MIRTLVISLAVVCAACGSKKQDGDTKDQEKPAAPAAAAAPKPAAELFAGPKVSFPSVVAKLRLDIPEAEAKAGAPELFAADAKYGYKVPGYDKVEVNAYLQDGRLSQIYLKLDGPPATVAGWLEPKWGKPRVTKNSIGDAEYWFDSPDVGLRAKLEPYATTGTILRYDRVMSREQLLGSDAKLWGFEQAPLIGMTPDDLIKAYAAYQPKPQKNDPTSIALTFPALTTSDHGSMLDARIKNGKVTGFVLTISTGGDAEADAAVAARLEQLYGKSKPDAVAIYTDYPGPPAVKAELRKDSASFSHTVWVGDYKQATK